ncbi:alpha/beta fold hydrolase [Streptomyces luteogriseus]|uniref:alpha/beta fold hydrolase n=1 Tax=Streptomyces luteogriseus TaxID=68233 RepID=UPI0037938B00
MSELRGAEDVDQFATLKSGLTICFRDVGEETDPVILLVAGLGEDLTSWPDSFVGELVARGFRVISLDNRDVGQSTFVSTPPPSLLRQLAARPRSDAYALSDMARDAIGVLDHLGLGRVHVVGRSMGGMIAQSIAAVGPDRVLSLSSIYSTTGARKVGKPALSTICLLAAPPARNRTAAVRAHLRIQRHIAGTAYPIDDVAEAAIAARAWERCAGDLAAGTARQIQAIQRSGDRTAQLGKITAPTLVIHGDRDLLVHPSGGEATARAISSARHVVIPGMGHHFPEALVQPIADYIAQHAHRVGEGEIDAEIS